VRSVIIEGVVELCVFSVAIEGAVELGVGVRLQSKAP
jgi:hypothetical protein